jgi:hypothetical protein
MPRSGCPSDHVPIAADLVWRDITPPTEATPPPRHRDTPKRSRAGAETVSAGVSVDTMGIAELKRLVAAAGLPLDGCIELPDLRARAREAQAALSRVRRTARMARGSARTAGGARAHIPRP